MQKQKNKHTEEYPFEVDKKKKPLNNALNANSLPNPHTKLTQVVCMRESAP